ncbi:MAG: molybdopterin-dependent oxidoreductase [Nitrospinae bacterium]|nr:molybdopterin-dependent oxidoreductase [Nitrospinota bacterium]
MNVSRRHLLRVAGRIAPLAVIGIPRDAQASMMGRLFDWLNSRPVETPRPGEDILAFAARVVPEVTPNDKFYVQSIGHTSPKLSRRKWRLNVKGEVTGPLSATYAGLSALRQEKTWATMTCIGNPVGGGQIGNALWEGIPLATLIERAGVSESVRRSVSARVIFRAADGYHDSISLEQALDSRTLLCARMNGEYLPRDHGAPLRLLVPGTYGLKNVKWIESIEVTTKGHGGYWQRRGWSDEAIVETFSRFEAPRRRVEVRTSDVWLVGSAFAGDRGIRKVEVTYGQGERLQSWAPALLKKPLGPLAWSVWAFPMHFEGNGFYPVTVRAVDSTGEVQTDKISDPQPGGSTGRMGLSIYVKGL